MLEEIARQGAQRMLAEAAVTPTASRLPSSSTSARKRFGRTWVVNPGHAPVDWRDPDLDFSRYSSTGVIGDPTHASAELGAKLWEAVVVAVASIFRSVGENDATFGT